jgi:hypothetical protein
LLAAALIHEAGHAAAALLAGFRIMGVRVGPVQFWRSKGWTWTLRVDNLVGGLVSAQLRDLPGPRARWQCIAFIAAGPLANFCAALLILPSFLSQTALATMGQFLALFSTAVGAANLIPFRTKRGFSDGANLYWLLFNKHKREELIFFLSLTARVQEVKALCGEKQFREALSKVDEMIDRARTVAGLNEDTEWMQRLAKLRGTLEGQAAGITTSQPEVSSAQL